MSGHGHELIGRESDLARVAELLDASPLVTLTGVGGVGKTSLAQASAAAARQADGTAWVDLVPAHDGPSVAAAFMAALEVSGLGERTVAEALRAAVGVRQMLLVVDNAEHVVDAAREHIAPLVRDCPGLGVLVTSREPLGLVGESHLVVAPLTTKAARELFERRAREVDSGWAITEGNAADVEEICETLDGIPLAVEFAAALVRTLDTAAIAERLHGALGFAAPGRRPRHVTLRSALAWSYELLEEGDRALLRGLSVFAGTFAADSVAAVCGDDAGMGLQRLVRRSLVARESGSDRYRLLEPVRQFAGERLDVEGERAAVEASHTAHFVEIAETAHTQLSGPEQITWHRRLTADYENMIAVLRRSSRAVGLTDEGTRIAVAIAWWWAQFDGRHAEGRRWLSKAVERLPEPGVDASVGRAAVWYAALDWSVRALDDVVAFVAAARTVVEGVDPWYAVLARAGVELPHVLTLSADHQDEWLARVSRDFVAAGDTGFGQTILLTVIGTYASLAGDLEHRRSALERRREIALRAGDGLGAAFPLLGLAATAMAGGERDEAARMVTEGLDGLAELRNRPIIANGMVVVAMLAADRGEFEPAARLLGAAVGLLDRAGTTLNPGNQADLAALIGACRGQLGEETYDRAHAAGLKLTAEAAYELTRDVLAGRGPRNRFDGLTRRQREVAELIAAGKSNREIAELLVISEHTAERHVENILARLGLSSRVQVATWFLAGER